MIKISHILKDLLNKQKYKTKEISSLLNKNEQSVRNKYVLDNFNFKEIMMCLLLCDYQVQFSPISDNDNRDTIIIDAEKFLSPEDFEKVESVKNNHLYSQLSFFDEDVDDVFPDTIPDHIKDQMIDKMIKALESKKSNS